MTTNKPDVLAWYFPSSKTTLPVISLNAGNGNGQALIRLSDYERLQAECEKLRTTLDAHKAARIAYASEFPLGADGTPDVGSIHENIRLLKKDVEFGRYVLDKQCREAVAAALGFMRGGDYAWSYLLQQIKEITSVEQKPAPDVSALVEALEQIERWDGFPSTGKTWEGSGEPVSYGAAFGSNGERDFMREAARKAITTYRKGGDV